MTNLKVSPEEAIALLTERIGDLKNVQAKTDGSPYYNFVGWCSKTWQAIDAIYGPDDPRAEEIRSMGMPACSCASAKETLGVAEPYVTLLMKYLDEIQAGQEDRQ
jgi:hypothetical protein